jgi:hypothetical protein
MSSAPRCERRDGGQLAKGGKKVKDMRGFAEW